MRTLLLAALAFLSCGILAAQTSGSGLDLSAIKQSSDPCQNFYQYACGNWIEKNPIPPDQSTWGRFNELDERNLTTLRQIAERAANSKDTRSPVEQKVGDFYASCMDEAGVEQKGLQPIKPMLDRIAQLSDKAALADEIARLHREGIPALFRFDSTQDFKDASKVIAEVDQGGLSLPDRDYYFKDDAKSVELRQKFVAHVQKMFELMGDSAEAAAAKAKVIMKIETGLAKGSLDRVARREPSNLYHPMPVADLAKLNPAFAWPKYLRESGAPSVPSLNVAVPDFFKQLQTVLTDTSLEDLKTYLTWKVLRDAAPFLPKAFVEENFNFVGRTLSGAKELQPRWKRCVRQTDAKLGEALGQKYVEQTFGVEGKQRTLQMVRDIEAVMQKDIEALDWMSPETKKQALVKLHAVANKIGYPEKWRDYGAVKIVRDDLIGNAMRADMFEIQRQLNKIGKPVDKGEWLMTPPTVNAYYDPQMNNINFPAGILQPPFYNNKADDAVNYGAIGAVVGHELTHGFDDEGRQFDPDGNLKDWWTAQDAKAFEQRAECIVKQYGNYTAVGDLKLNGKLTLGENAADNGGVRLAYMALMDSLAKRTLGKVDGYTPQQRFFLGYAQVWCSNTRDETKRLRALTDPHSPGEYRVNGVLSNMPEFQQAFGCKAGQPMVSANACRIW